MYEKSRAWVEINKTAILNNLNKLNEFLPKGCEMMPCIKANAFGHGMTTVGKILYDNGVRYFCVACLWEAIELRKAGIDCDILILGYTHPDDYQDLIKYDLVQTVIDAEHAKELNAAGMPLRVHVAVDTGMHRIGERLEDFDKIKHIWDNKNLKIEGVYSHLCVSDEYSEESRQYTLMQINSFNELIDKLHTAGIDGFKVHIQASAGAVNYPDYHYDYARLGYILWGTDSDHNDKSVERLGLDPVLSLKARVFCVKPLYKGETVSYGRTFTAEKDMRIAVVGIGYADGLPKQLSNNWYLLINGHRCNFVGRMCMDQLMVDVTDHPEIKRGDEAVIIGSQGDEAIRACDLAGSVGLNTNAVLTKLADRLGRVITE